MPFNENVEVFLDWVEANLDHMEDRRDDRVKAAMYLQALRTDHHVIMPGSPLIPGTTQDLINHMLLRLNEQLPYTNKLARHLGSLATAGKRTFDNEVMEYLHWVEMNMDQMRKIKRSPPAWLYLKAIHQHSKVMYSTIDHAHYIEGRVGWQISTPMPHGLCGLELWDQLLKLHMMTPLDHRDLADAAVDAARGKLF